jgi:hypothetical protein
MLKQCYLMSVVVSKIQFYKLTTSLVSARAHALLGCLLRALARLRVRCADRSASVARCKPLLALAFSMRARLAPRATCFLLRTRRTPRREERREEQERHRGSGSGGRRRRSGKDRAPLPGKVRERGG